MTDQNTNLNSDDGAGGAGDQGGGAGGGGEGGSWLDKLNLPEDVRAHATVAKYAASPEAFARGLIHLEGHLGAPAEQLLRLPKPDDKDGMGAIYNKLGRPEKPDGYTAKIEGDAMDAAAFDAFKAQAHELGITNAQLEGLTKWYAATGQQTMQQLEAADKAAREAADLALKQEWGGAYGDKIDAAAEMAAKFGGEELDGYLKETGLGNDPRMLKAWAAVADAMGEAGAGFDPSQRGRDSNRGPTPAEAEAELVKMETDPEIQKILLDPTHPNKKFYHEKRLALIKAKGAGKA